jgi:PhzF family phenazine biosynthesis protein
MMINAYSLRAFTTQAAGGNLAGVVIDTEKLTATDMLHIAHQLGFSETAYLFPCEDADYQVRYFTPAEEVDICGHATVALFTYLYQKNEITAGDYTIKTGIGVLNVQVRNNGQIFLQQAAPQFLDILSPAEIADSLNTDSAVFSHDLPVQIVSTGLKDILIPVRSFTALAEIKPDLDKVAAISKKYQVTGYHLFTTETLSPSAAAHCRNLAPLYDIPEECATGTSNAALACYLVKYLPDYQRQEKQTLLFEQGYSMGLPSEILAELTQSAGRIVTIFVGGRAEYQEMITIELS